MKKKFLLSIFSIFIGFLFFGNVNATIYKSHCVYRNDFNEVDIKFDIRESNWITIESAECSDGEDRFDCTDSFSEFKGVNQTKPNACYEGELYSSIEKYLDKILGEDHTFSRVYGDESVAESSCLDYKKEKTCESPSDDFACVWNESEYGDYCNVDNLLYVRCGDAKDIPHQAPKIISFAVNFLKILTPIILIVVSIISLLKAVAASNEDEIKKAQKGLIRKVIAAVMVFLVITIVQFVIMKFADSEIESDENGEVETTNLSDCLNCFLNNNCKESVYYKTYIGSELIETPVTDIKN